jgi:hypothetical protein
MHLKNVIGANFVRRNKCLQKSCQGIKLGSPIDRQRFAQNLANNSDSEFQRNWISEGMFCMIAEPVFLNYQRDSDEIVAYRCITRVF